MRIMTSEPTGTSTIRTAAECLCQAYLGWLQCFIIKIRGSTVTCRAGQSVKLNPYNLLLNGLMENLSKRNLCKNQTMPAYERD